MLLDPKSITELFSGRVRKQPPPQLPKNIVLTVSPNDGTEHDHERLAELRICDADLGYNEGQSFIIDYNDAEGDRSVRRITVWDIRMSANDCVYLIAYCHEVQATKRIRFDRIHAIYDYDGIAQKPLEKFFVESFGLTTEFVSAAFKNDDCRKYANERMSQIRTMCRLCGVHLLCALAISHGNLYTDETIVILDYAKSFCGRAGIVLTDRDLKATGRYIRRLRPTERTISTALARVQFLSTEDKKRLLIAAEKVVNADGEADSEKRDLIELLNMELNRSRRESK